MNGLELKYQQQLVKNLGYVESKYPLAQYLVEKYKNESKPYWTKSDIETATANASERIVNFIFGENLK